MSIINNINIKSIKEIKNPNDIIKILPISDNLTKKVIKWREIVSNILDKKDNRLLLVVGPCSIHDYDMAIYYANFLKEIQKKFNDRIFIIMRVYFEKPRTTTGWKGLINDPNINDTFDIETGLAKARELLIWLAELEIPVATEALDPISPQYLAELFAWSAIGARTSESQTHREMASGLSMPVGFKNGTDGSLGIAINALQSAASGHSFMGINKQGQVSIIQTQGNPDGHIILRGGKTPNYDSVCVADCEAELEKAKLPASLIVDCSHANSSKDYRRQTLVAQNVVNQILEGNESIMGIMLESHLNAGNQSSNGKTPAELEYGVSITDGCINWDATAQLINQTRDKLITVLPMRLNKRAQQ